MRSSYQQKKLHESILNELNVRHQNQIEEQRREFNESSQRQSEENKRRFEEGI